MKRLLAVTLAAAPLLAFGADPRSDTGHDHAAMMAPDMKDPKAVKGLTAVGRTAVRVRTGRLH